MIKKGRYKECFKKASLSKSDLKNYRPVSNLSFVSKVSERVVDSQIRSHMTENDLFEDMQSAYRSNHSTETALVKVTNDILQALDQKKMVGLVLLDLSAAFDTVNHSVLLNRLQHRIGLSGKALDWVKSYLSNRSQRVTVKGKFSEAFNLDTGVPQGSVLGPLLFSIYMGPLGDLIRSHGIIVHFYADDTQVYLCFEPAHPNVSLEQLEACIDAVRRWMAANFLKLNDGKTEFILLTSKHNKGNLGGHSPSVRIGEHDIQAVPVARNIGALFDENFTFHQHASSVVKSCFHQLHIIGLIKKFLSYDATAKLINAFVTSRLDNLNGLLIGLPQQELSRLQRVQNSAARLLTGSARWDHISPILHDLHWLPVRYRIDFKILLLTFKCVHGIAPKYLRDLLSLYNPCRSLRSADRLLLHQPRSRLASYGDRSFACAAPRLWNNLPFDIRSSESVSVFKRELKTHLFTQWSSGLSS